jgi:hypothetical protein
MKALLPLAIMMALQFSPVMAFPKAQALLAKLPTGNIVNVITAEKFADRF